MIALFTRAEQALEGWPDATLSLMLILAAFVLVLIALYGSALQKSVALAYVVFP